MTEQREHSCEQRSGGSTMMGTGMCKQKDNLDVVRLTDGL